MHDVIVEIARGSRLKYEVDKGFGMLRLDRVLHGSNVYPHNYGYIPGTLDLDGDPLDVIIVSGETLAVNSIAPVRIVGALEMIDSGDRDTKLVGVLGVDPRYDGIMDIVDLPSGILNEIRDFFSNYKLLESKEVKVGEFLGQERANKIIVEGKGLHMEKYGNG